MKKTVTKLAAAAAITLGAVTGAKADTPFVGEIRSFGFGFCPVGWAATNGALLSVSANDALFSLLGTTYGGDGITTFGLPDLRGRVPLHTGTGPGLSPRPQGQTSGSEYVNILVQNMPSHNHLPTGNLDARLLASSEDGASNSPQGGYFPSSSQTFYASTEGTKQDMAAGLVEVDLSGEIIGQNGASQSEYNLAPYVANEFCIALFGIYPSRN